MTTSVRAEVNRPRNVAVSPDGSIVLVTSLATNNVAQRTTSGVSYIAVGAPSWGVCFLDANNAVVTHPGSNKLTRLVRSGSALVSNGSVTVPYTCTEVIASPTAGRVLVANRGMKPAVPTAEPWQHAVYEIDIASGAITRTFRTEREPRGLALSPDGTILFVGHIQGAFDGPGLGETVMFNNHDHPVFDGGSIVSFDYVTATPEGAAPVDRFPVGSPVRHVAVWPTPATPAAARPPDGAYRIYFVHVGDANQSEDPQFGGRMIPNVISSIGFDSNNNPRLDDRQDTVFGHDPDHPDDVSSDLAAVLHERLTFAWRNDGGWIRELWVANSASGTVSRAGLDSDGRIVTAGTIDVKVDPDCSDCELPVAIGRTAFEVTTANAKSVPNIATTVFDVISQQAHVRVDRLPDFRIFDSHPAGLAYDAANDVVWATTLFDQELLQVATGGTTPTVTARFLLGSQAVPVEERNFFTFGRGFDFREDAHTSSGNPTLPVQTQSCATCHVDGHLDGKVRTSVRFADNVPLSGSPTKTVAVPSVFDVGKTEWIFFEGLKTVVDARLGNDVDHLYVTFLEAGMFTDTNEFTDVVSTPRSPHAPGGQVNTLQTWGRYYFQKMNCTRCHSGPTGASFDRVAGSPNTTTPPLVEAGPFPSSLVTNNRLLHDPTQSFVTGSSGLPNQRVSFRNMTDVGTRAEGDGVHNGINTPALAGAWDNTPYMHDGRYRTLEAVLANTWLDTSGDTLAVPRLSPLLGLTDNAMGGSVSFVGDARIPAATFGLVETFAHAPSRPANRISVVEFLESKTTAAGASALTALLEFLRSVSSQTDLCPPVEVLNFSASVSCDSTAVLSWETSIPIACKVKYGIATQWSLAVTDSTPESSTHSLTIDVKLRVKDYRAEITMDNGASPPANNPVCRRVDVVNKPWKTLNCFNDTKSALYTQLLDASPNPFNPVSQIRYTIAERGRASLRIYDVRGTLVATVLDKHHDPGRFTVTWRGISDQGVPASSGIYFAVLENASTEDRLRLVLLK